MRTQLTNHGSQLGSIKPEPAFQLPPPPPGMRWHREDRWTADDLPSGYRPLVFGEPQQEGDEFRGPSIWKTMCAVGDESDATCYHRRTTRPLTFEHAGKTWTYHRPGDPMPCDGERRVEYVFRTRETSAYPSQAKDLRWNNSDEATHDNDIIGWRYADEKKTVPLGPEDVPPGSVIRSDSWTYGGHVTPSVFLGVVCWANTSGNVYLTYEQLAKQGWQINRPRHRDADGNPTKWEPCSKEVPV